MDHINPSVVKEIKKEHSDIMVHVKVEPDQLADEIYNQVIIKSEITIAPEVKQETTTSLATENLLVEDVLKNKNDFDSNEPQTNTKKHTKKKSEFICDVCNKKYRKKHTLKKHIGKFHDLDWVKHTCNYCEKEYFFKDSLRRHIQVVHLKATVSKCDLCSKVFCDRKTRDFHVKNVCPKNLNRSTRKYHAVLCKLCNKVFSDERSRSRHLKYACLKNNARIKRPLGPLESHSDAICHLCNKVFYDKKTKDRHVESACPMNTMKPTISKYKREAVCEFCNKSFSSTSVRNKHSQHACHMNRNRTKRSRYSEVTCNLCNKILCSSRSLERHIKHTCPKNQYKIKSEAKCSFCDKVIKEDYAYEHAKFYCSKNKNNFEDKKLYKCDTCTTVCDNKRDLVKHFKTSCAILGM